MPAKVLVVEDDPLNSKLICDLLLACGYVADSVANGVVAMDRIMADPPDFLILDVQLPGLSGLDILRRIRADAGLRPIRVMVVSGCVMKGDEETARAAGCDDFVGKPISIATLLVQFRTILGELELKLANGTSVIKRSVAAQHG